MKNQPSASSTDVPIIVPKPQWVISDTHFGHSRILEYCPWRSSWAANILEHDAAIISAWRNRIHSDDWVLHLGDFALGTVENIKQLRRQLPGRIILIRGNHDRSLQLMREAGFDRVHSAARIEYQGLHWIARHNPSAFSKAESLSAMALLHGHCHGNGYRDDMCTSVRIKCVDCSLDAVKSLAPLPWDDAVRKHN